MKKTEILKDVVVKLSKTHVPPNVGGGCDACFDEILNAGIDCLLSFDPVQCVMDTLGTNNPCYNCVCVLIPDVGTILGQDWHC